MNKRRNNMRRIIGDYPNPVFEPHIKERSNYLWIRYSPHMDLNNLSF
jgi:hypothetical protein